MSQTETLRQLLQDVAHLDAAIAVLGWDQETHMPEGGAEARAATIASLSGARHAAFTRKEVVEEVARLQLLPNLPEEDVALVREVARDLQHATKLPKEFVSRMAEVCSKGQVTWAAARAANQFSDFAPVLEEIVKLKQEEAELIGYTGSPYNALLDSYEPGATVESLTTLFAELRDGLVALLEKVDSTPRRVITGTFPAAEQLAFVREIATSLGYQFERGGLDQSAHPFSTSFHPTDSRITTRIFEDDIAPCLGATIHEVGHALYEQGLPVEHFGTPLGQAASVGIHESQSRSWENLVGRSQAFWDYVYPKLQARFPDPFAKVSQYDFMRSYNYVAPSLIRIESDEVTYNLHIIIRFELEQALIEGRLAVVDLPTAWNEKVKKYLGIEVSDDAHGVLQDVHWSCGYFGYFPTYTLGNLYAAQMWEVVQKDIPDLQNHFAVGDFSLLLAWFREHIHRHGRRYLPSELIEQISGSSLTVTPLLTHLAEQYT